MSKNMIVAATPKPLSKMTDDDVRAWAKQVHEQLVKQDAQRSLSSSLPPTSRSRSNCSTRCRAIAHDHDGAEHLDQ